MSQSGLPTRLSTLQRFRSPPSLVRESLPLLLALSLDAEPLGHLLRFLVERRDVATLGDP